LVFFKRSPKPAPSRLIRWHRWQCQRLRPRARRQQPRPNCKSISRPTIWKKAQIRTARIATGITAAKLRVPGIVKANEYREVHVTPLVGGIVKEVPVVLGDHVKRGQALAIIFSSELAEAETQYVSYLAELEAEHKKLERTQNLLKLGAASQQEEEEVAATHAAHESHVRAALEKLKLPRASDRQIAALKQAEQIIPIWLCLPPIGGVVLTRNAISVWL